MAIKHDASLLNRHTSMLLLTLGARPHQYLRDIHSNSILPFIAYYNKIALLVDRRKHDHGMEPGYSPLLFFPCRSPKDGFMINGWF